MNSTKGFDYQWLIGVIIGFALFAGLFSFFVSDRFEDKSSELGQKFEYNLDNLRKIDPSLILYEETHEPIQTEINNAHVIATAPDDTIYVGGEVVRAFSSEGRKRPFKVDVEGELTAITVDTEGSIYLGVDNHIEMYNTSGEQQQRWDPIDEQVYITSIAVFEDHIFVADYHNTEIHHFDTSGNKLNSFGDFILPSAYMDVAIADEDRLWVANTGRHRLEEYSFNGNMQTFWGEFSSEIHGFCGCCNPVNFALLPNGEGFVTCEKGLTRVKIYDPNGKFMGVVAGPESFAQHDKITASPNYDTNRAGLDVAVDSKGRILVMDPALTQVRVFEKKAEETPSES